MGGISDGAVTAHASISAGCSPKAVKPDATLRCAIASWATRHSTRSKRVHPLSWRSIIREYVSWPSERAGLKCQPSAAAKLVGGAASGTMLDTAYSQTAEQVGCLVWEPPDTQYASLNWGSPPAHLAELLSPAPPRPALLCTRKLRLQVHAHYHVDPRQGLSAGQVAEARRQHGRNELAPEPGAAAQPLLLHLAWAPCLTAGGALSGHLLSTSVRPGTCPFGG